MAYDEEFLDRVRVAVRGVGPGPVEEKRMFGGVAFMLAGHMSVVVRGKGGLMVRVDPAQAQQFAGEPGAQPTAMRGQTMRGWITVDARALAKDADLHRWVKRGVTFTRTLPAKSSS